jgi:hypothetical protein
MRRLLMVGLLLLNVLLAVFLFSTVADSQIIPRSLRNCCKYDGPEPYCCWKCCIGGESCGDDMDCL